jgi:hypothetical protein
MEKQQLKEAIMECLQDIGIIKNPSIQDDFISTEDACVLLKVTAETLWRWRKQNIITGHKIRNRVYYKRSELLNALQPSS